MGLGAGALSLSVPLSLRVSDVSWGSVRNVGFLGPASGAVLRRPRASNAGAARDWRSRRHRPARLPCGAEAALKAIVGHIL